MNRMQITNIHALFSKEIQDLYSAEKQIQQSLPKLIEAASSKDLQNTLEKHLTSTENHIDRIEKVASSLDIKLNGMICQGMKGLLTESNEIMLEIDDPYTKDAAIIGAVQRIEHYEIAAYETAISHALSMKHDTQASLLKKTLTEETDENKILTTIDKKTINKKTFSA